MKAIFNSHWTLGGTGITNFDKADYDIYDLSIKEFVAVSESNIGLKIHLKGFHTNEKIRDMYYSLHDTYETNRDLSNFWEIFRSNKSRLRNDPPRT